MTSICTLHRQGRFRSYARTDHGVSPNSNAESYLTN
nr:MAG TPA: hypothetical protein [Caudoviricetes sp.]DAL69274.1 MAG TPA: hypothetical protein [Caudoviricetes sp.]